MTQNPYQPEPEYGSPEPSSGTTPPTQPLPQGYGTASQYPAPGYPPPGQAPYPPPGQPYGYPPLQHPYGYDPNLDPGAKSRLAAGLLGIFLGALGIHRFYLGYTGIGLTMLLVTVIGFFPTFGLAPIAVSIWGLVEGILYLTAKQGTYAVDSTGRPLRA
ncbi:TM2 domain-containing protein [Cellulosimicrobium marinum]|uniref:TM2 domain-containing protein n=1 Tax=Cellulosimicrobium marinum TaxID=1638992 RepID=UPI001E41A7D6|nr:TM2 domain-containing protein [Cellulosimicrobium marinum]MCB7135090.1 TM2 domain-containing protein [Cellulosimicrobium marinum]